MISLRLRRSLPVSLVIAGMIAYTVAMSVFSIGRAENFNAGWYDLGIMTQTVWNVGHGHGFTFTNPEEGTGGVHGVNMWRMAIHTDYVLILLAPLSWLPGATATYLLIVQSAVLALGALFIFRLTRRILGSEWLGVLLAAVYLSFPALQFANLFEFHAVTLSVTFFLGAADAAMARRRAAFWVWVALALITKEQVGITLGLLGWWLWWRQGQRRLAWTALVICWAWVALQFLVVIPLSRPGLPGNFVYEKFYGSAGSDAGSIASSLADPRQVWERLMTTTHFNNLKVLFGPLGVVAPLFAPALLVVTLPEVLIYWLSDSPNQQTLFLHYHALFIPGIFLAAISGWQAIERLAERLRPAAAGGVRIALVALVVFGAAYTVRNASPWWWSPISRWPLVAWKERQAPQVAEAIALVPAGSAVGVTQNLGVHLAEHPVVQLLPNGLTTVDYLVILERKFDPNIPTNDKRLAEKVMLERLIPWLEASPAYERLYRAERVHVFRRTGVPTQPEPEWPEGLLGR